MISSGFICPTPTILLPGILDNEIESNFSDTISSLSFLNEVVLNTKPDIIFCFCVSDVSKITCNLNIEYLVSFEDFGEFQTKFSVLGDVFLSKYISKELNFDIITKDCLDYKISVPLSFILKNISNKKIIPIYIPYNYDLKELFLLGKKLKKIFLGISDNLSVACFGDISYFDKKNIKQVERDKELITLIENKSIYKILNVKKKFVKNSNLVTSFCLMSGIFDKINYRVDSLSYDNYLDIGYYTCNYEL